MADREVNMNPEESPEIPEVLESLLLFALDECKDHILNDAAEEVTPVGADPEDTREVVLDGSVPFTVLAVKDNLFIETHPGDTAEACYASARHTVAGARGATAYVLCYDGYVETDDGNRDCIIAEGGMPGEEEGFAVGYLYRKVGEVTIFDGDPVFIGPAPNFMAELKEVSAYDDADIDDRYKVDGYEDEDMEAAAEGAAEFMATHPEGKLSLTFEATEE